MPRRGPNWAKLHKRQADARPRVMARLAETRDAPPVTLESLRELVAAAKAAGEDTIELTVRRAERPKQGRTIRLMVLVGDSLKAGPYSSADHQVEPACGRNWTTRWRTLDCDLWVEKMERRR